MTRFIIRLRRQSIVGNGGIVMRVICMVVISVTSVVVVVVSSLCGEVVTVASLLSVAEVNEPVNSVLSAEVEADNPPDEHPPSSKTDSTTAIHLKFFITFRVLF